MRCRVVRWLGIGTGVLALGCALVHERDAGSIDGGSDAPSIDVGTDASCDPRLGGDCCHYGTSCALGAPCTDPAAPICVPFFTDERCAAATECGRLCASPDTPVATPSGERPIASLRVGDVVMSVDRGVLRAVRIARIARNPVTQHAVVRVVLESGRVVAMSAGHPTADGRTFGALRPGDTLGDARIASVETVPYAFDATYDILPASSTGTYLAAGALVGSTLVTRSEARCAP